MKSLFGKHYAITSFQYKQRGVKLSQRNKFGGNSYEKNLVLSQLILVYCSFNQLGQNDNEHNKT